MQPSFAKSVAKTEPIRRPSVLLHDALERVLVATGKIHDLRHLGLGDLVGEHAADADAAAVDMEHDARGLLPALGEEPFEHVNDELHRSVIVVQHQNLVHRGLLGFRLVLNDDAGSLALITALMDATHRTECTEGVRSEEHTSELQSLMSISYAVFCLKKKRK